MLMQSADAFDLPGRDYRTLDSMQAACFFPESGQFSDAPAIRDRC